jgi:hypothetical protein
MRGLGFSHASGDRHQGSERRNWHQNIIGPGRWMKAYSSRDITRTTTVSSSSRFVVAFLSIGSPRKEVRSTGTIIGTWGRGGPTRLEGAATPSRPGVLSLLIRGHSTIPLALLPGKMTKSTIDNGEDSDVAELSDQPVSKGARGDVGGFTLVVIVGTVSGNQRVRRVVRRVCMGIKIPR